MSDNHTLDYFTALYAQLPPSACILVWTLSDKYSHWCENAEEAAQFAASLPLHDVYAGLGFAPRGLPPTRRAKEFEIVGIPGVWLDLDYGVEGHKQQKNPPTREDARSLLGAFTLPPSMVVHSGGGLHAYWLFDAPWILADAADREAAKRLLQRFGELAQRAATAHGWHVDSVHDLSRVLRVPGTLNHKHEPPRRCTIEDAPMHRYTRAQLTELVDDLPQAERRRSTRAASPSPAAIAVRTDGRLPDGFDALYARDARFARTWDRQRDDMRDTSSSGYAMALAHAAVSAGWSDQDAIDLMAAWRVKHHEPEKPADWYKRTIDKVRSEAADGEAPLLTDMGNAQRLYRHHGEDLRYVYEWKCWLIWNGTRWVRDAGKQIMERAKATARAIFVEASASDDEKTQKAIASWAIKSQARKGLENMIVLTQDLCATSPNDFDQDLYLWNSPNGTTDLRTGEMREHRREDLITKLSPINRDASATCPIWRANLDRFMNGDQDMIAYLQRWAGYALTGDVSERSMEIAYGQGGNWKSTFIDTLQEIWGDYARAIATETLMVTKYDRSGPELAQLPGVRLAIASEGERSQSLAVARVKRMTGGAHERITAEAKYQAPITFTPTHKIFFMTNKPPIIHDATDGTWDRVHLQPWRVTIPIDERDKRFPEKLRAEYAGILEWAIQGCLTWYKDGLQPPQAVKDASSAYRDEMDIVAQFLASETTPDPGNDIASSSLWNAFTMWCDTNKIRPIDNREFKAQLEHKGYENKRKKSGYVWLGLKLGHDEDAESPPDNKQLVYGGVVVSRELPNARACVEKDGKCLHHPTPEPRDADIPPAAAMVLPASGPGAHVQRAPVMTATPSADIPRPGDLCGTCEKSGMWSNDAGTWRCHRCGTPYQK